MGLAGQEIREANDAWEHIQSALRSTMCAIDAMEIRSQQLTAEHSKLKMQIEHTTDTLTTQGRLLAGCSQQLKQMEVARDLAEAQALELKERNRALQDRISTTITNIRRAAVGPSRRWIERQQMVLPPPAPEQSIEVFRAKLHGVGDLVFGGSTCVHKPILFP